MHGEKFQKFIQEINTFIHMQTPTTPISQEEQRGLEAILNVNVFEERYPFPGSKKYQAVINFMQENLGDYPFSWYILFLWNDLRLMGRVITDNEQSSEISRSWMDEWGLNRQIQNLLEELGFDYHQAQSGVTILNLLIRQQDWITDIEEMTSVGLLERWLTQDEVRSFLNINRYRGKLYFNKEAFESLMWWMLTIGVISIASNPEKSLAEFIEHLNIGFDRINDLLSAEKESEFQLDILLELLK